MNLFESMNLFEEDMNGCLRGDMNHHLRGDISVILVYISRGRSD